MTRTGRRSWQVGHQAAGLSSYIDGYDLCRAFYSESRPLVLEPGPRKFLGIFERLTGRANCGTPTVVPKTVAVGLC